jgi:hypothetical protein
MFNIVPLRRPGPEPIYDIYFHLHGRQGYRGSGGESKRAPKSAWVRVDPAGNGAVLHYHPPDPPVEGFAKEDYEAKALEVAKAEHAP